MSSNSFVIQNLELFRKFQKLNGLYNLCYDWIPPEDFSKEELWELSDELWETLESIFSKIKSSDIETTDYEDKNELIELINIWDEVMKRRDDFCNEDYEESEEVLDKGYSLYEKYSKIDSSRG